MFFSVGLCMVFLQFYFLCTWMASVSTRIEGATSCSLLKFCACFHKSVLIKVVLTRRLRNICSALMILLCLQTVSVFKISVCKITDSTPFRCHFNGNN